MLESLAAEQRYCAVAVESPFSTADEMSFERVSGPLHLGPWFGKTFGRPVIWSAVLYARLHYGVNLLQPSPLKAVQSSTTPILLIHGERDRSISPHHSEILAKAAPGRVQLWIVPSAGHTMAWSAAHQEFERRLLGWFLSHHQEAKPFSSTSSVPANGRKRRATPAEARSANTELPTGAAKKHYIKFQRCCRSLPQK
jgi:hypothetical protein